ncbi:MAG: hypothetical protein LBL45_00150, partial [Treponema sp.]|nr:hypothetical protein [Treponema sp.]
GRVTASHVESQGAGEQYKQPRKMTDESLSSLFPWGKYPAPWGADFLFFCFSTSAHNLKAAASTT